MPRADRRGSPAAYIAPETAAAERARAELARLFGGKS
jgi:hypothetical protein